MELSIKQEMIKNRLIKSINGNSYHTFDIYNRIVTNNGEFGYRSNNNHNFIITEGYLLACIVRGSFKLGLLNIKLVK